MGTLGGSGAGLSLAARAGSRGGAVAGILLGAALVVFAAGRVWARVTVPELPGRDLVTADGRLIAPAAPALALVAAAGAVVLVTSGRIVRAVVAVLLASAGLGIVALSGAPLMDPAGAVAPAVARVTGTTGAPVPPGATATAWPAVSGIGGLLVAAGGVIGMARGRRWAGPSRKYERTAARTGRSGPSSDPSTGSSGAVGSAAGSSGAAGPAAGSVSGAATGTGEGGAADARDDRLTAWDRLSAGEDPTD